MQALRQDMLTFATSLSGIPIPEGEEKKYQDSLWTSVGGEWVPRTDWRLFINSYHTGRFKEWVYAVFESVIQLIKDLNVDNVGLIEGRFTSLKKYYYEMRNQPKSLYGGAGSTYEKAFNKHYYN
jgi:hypothetical protein